MSGNIGSSSFPVSRITTVAPSSFRVTESVQQQTPSDAVSALDTKHVSRADSEGARAAG